MGTGRGNAANSTAWQRKVHACDPLLKLAGGTPSLQIFFTGQMQPERDFYRRAKRFLNQYTTTRQKG